MSSLPTYRYQPLESASTVRILVLHPAEDFAAPIRVRIVHADQEALLFGETETQGYEAVSYCWGDPTPTHSIICDDAFTRGVTRNVDTMLRYLRRAGRPRRIWVDALCLNQQDLEEKTEQVRRMGRVYQCAMKVHVWLGETDKADPEVRLFAGLRAIAALRLHPTEEYEPVLDILGRVFGGNYEAYIDSFFSRKWFSRRWIVQECALNHQVVVRCGRHKILWAWFKRGVFLLDRARVRFCQEARDALSMVMSFDSPTMNAATLSKLLWSFHASECSLPEDRIFSLLGLAQDTGLNLDYESSWPETYTRVTSAYYDDFLGRPLEMFTHLAGFGPIKQEGYPSWVPDWTTRRQEFKFLRRVARGGGPSDDFSLTKERKLRIRSYYRGSVDAPNSTLASVAEKVSLVLGKLKESGQGLDSLISVLWACVDDYGEKLPEDPDLDFVEKRRRSRVSVETALKPLIANSSNTTAAFEQEPTAQKIYSVLETHSLFSINLPWQASAIGPKETQSGDLVLYYPGMCLPDRGYPLMFYNTYLGFVTRPLGKCVPKQASDGFFANCRFIGLCFFSGSAEGMVGDRVIVELV